MAAALVLAVIFGNTGLFKGSMTGDVFAGPKVEDASSCESNGGKWVKDTASLPAKFAMADTTASTDETPQPAAAEQPAAQPAAEAVVAPPTPSSHCEYNGVKVTYVAEIAQAKFKTACDDISIAKWGDDGKCKIYSKTFDTVDTLVKGNADFTALQTGCSSNGGAFVDGVCSIVIAGNSTVIKSNDDLNSALFATECKKAAGTFANNQCSIDKVGTIDNIDDLKNIKLRVLCSDATAFSSGWTENGASWDNTAGICNFFGTTFSGYDGLMKAYNTSNSMKELCLIMGGSAATFTNNKCLLFTNRDIMARLCTNAGSLYNGVLYPYAAGIGTGGWVDRGNAAGTAGGANCNFSTLTETPGALIQNQSTGKTYVVTNEYTKENYAQIAEMYGWIKKQIANLQVFSNACTSFGGIPNTNYTSTDLRYLTSCTLNNKLFSYFSAPSTLAAYNYMVVEKQAIDAVTNKNAQIQSLQDQLNAQATAAKSAADQAAADQVKSTADKAAADKIAADKVAADKAWQDKLNETQAANDKAVKDLQAQIAAKEKAFGEQLSATKAAAAEKELQDLKQRLAETKADAKAAIEKAAAERPAALPAQQPSSSTQQSDPTMALLRQQLADQKTATDKAIAELQELKAQLLRAQNQATIDALSKKIDDQVMVIQGMNQRQSALSAQTSTAKTSTAKKTTTAKKKAASKLTKAQKQQMMQLMLKMLQEQE